MEKEEPSLWSQFEQLIGLHTFYFEHLIKAAAFSFGTVGAILTYVIHAAFEEIEMRNLALAFPLLISIGTFLIFCLGVWKTLDLTRSIKQMQQMLKLSWRPHSEILIWMCGIFAFSFLILSIGIILLMLKTDLITTP